MSIRIPPLLEPYTHLPPRDSLILLTSILGASTNWLILRFLYNALSPSGDSTGEADTAVVLVSFMRDFEFWKDGARRLGLDLPRLAQKSRFRFIDGLSDLFDSGDGVTSNRGEIGSQITLREPTSSGVGAMILQQVKALKIGRDGEERNVLLILDQPDLLLAATEDEVGAVRMTSLLMDLREHVYSIIVTVAADSPLTQSPTTPLETQHTALLVTLAHQASYVISLRLLDTGTARDISGVMRVTMGPEGADGDGVERRDGGITGAEEKELLYFVGGDGGVKVFERGQ
ncbi:MAG: hypothetical protein M1812_005690 [Candelaria pacifica]|nr:MAG: hypothetical protein M1812_005690 [Candelaria pacifica]